MPDPQQQRFVVMTAAQFVSKALQTLVPPDRNDLDVVAFVLRSVHEQFGPTYWASTPPDKYVDAAQPLIAFCRAYSNPQSWYEKLQAEVVKLEARKKGPASLQEVGRTLLVNDEDPAEQAARLTLKMCVGC